jgi:hypothetical protein
MKKPTKAQRKVLEWFASNGKACLFGPGDPSLSMVKKMCGLGLIEYAGREPGKLFAMTYFQISERGRAALSDQSEEA